jgi:3,4-dihydroxy 2-butanone 4-phosphate synthase/GTP cyclohydrolase II
MRTYSSVEAAIEALADGRLVIVVDSEDRENEGDFLAAAETITPQTIHFMTSQGRGHLCMPVSPQIAQRLSLTPMVPRRTLTMPCFTVPVDHCQCKTGISPAERVMTIRAMVDSSSRPGDFVRPGHTFPLIAQEEGVFRRQGHTEAAVDLARLAGFAPAGVLCEICSRDGLHMAYGEELMELAQEFHLPIVSIDSLLEFQLRRVGHVEAGTDYGQDPGLALGAPAIS